MDKIERVASSLKSRIGELVSEYETKLAILRAQAEEQVESLQKTNADLEREIDRLNDAIQAQETARTSEENITES